MNILQRCTSNSYFYILWQARRGVNHPDLATPWLTFPTGIWLWRSLRRATGVRPINAQRWERCWTTSLAEATTGDRSPLDVLLSSWVDRLVGGSERVSAGGELSNSLDRVLGCDQWSNGYWSPLLPNTYSIITYWLLHYSTYCPDSSSMKELYYYAVDWTQIAQGQGQDFAQIGRMSAAPHLWPQVGQVLSALALSQSSWLVWCFYRTDGHKTNKQTDSRLRMAWDLGVREHFASPLSYLLS